MIFFFFAFTACDWFGGAPTDSADPADTGAGDSADTEDTTSGGDTALAADDARVRALTDLPEGDATCREPLLARVVHITDGDTVYVQPDDGSAELKVRFIGIDTPEIAHDPDPADCYGDEAMAYTSAELSGHLVWLTFDKGCTDYYGRSLAYIIRGEGEAGFFNRELLQLGYAWTLTVDPNTTYADTFAADEAAAKRDGAGMWEHCP